MPWMETQRLSPNPNAGELSLDLQSAHDSGLTVKIIATEIQ